MTLRLIRRAAWLGLALSGLIAAAPARSQDQGVCGTITDPAARSSCVAVGRASLAHLRRGPPSVRSIVRPLASEPAEAVDGRDLAGAPDRYVGRPLSLRGGDCRYVDVNRYVCTTVGEPSVEIHAHVIMPPPAQVEVEAGRACGRKGASSRRHPCADLMLLTPTSVRSSGGPIVVTTSALWLRMSR